jgi:hypothetical protein
MAQERSAFDFISASEDQKKKNEEIQDLRD